MAERTGLRRLAVGEQAYLLVRAQMPWNFSGIEVGRDERYDLTVSDLWCWYDWYLPADADGVRQPNGFQRNTPGFLKRHSDSDFLALVGCVGKKRRNRFAIGAESKNQAMPTDGELGAFANDIRLFYGNNRGLLRLNITRLA